MANPRNKLAKKPKETEHERQIRITQTQHVHKYHKVWHFRKKRPAVQIWTCADRTCTHYWPEHLRNNIVGRASRCTQCDTLITMMDDVLEMDEPICTMCKFKHQYGDKFGPEQAPPSPAAMLDKIFGPGWDKPKNKG